ncbi:MAG: cation:proton antiporter [Verrucomicrobiota bacterium]
MILAASGNIELVQDLALVLLAAGICGWITQRIGLSAVVGYLLAGIFLGPLNSPMEVIKDVDTIRSLAELGLIFLLFGIGVEFSIRKLRRLGVQLVLSNLVAALVIFNLIRTAAQLMGFNEMEAIFMASMILISSSAIISKVLQDTKQNHERPGQLAMGTVIIEDALVVILLTLLGSYVKFADYTASGSDTAGQALQTTVLLIIFILFLLVLGFFFMPKLVNLLRSKATTELTTILITGLLLIISVLTVKVGYSLALGAFLFGALISEVPANRQIEKLLHGTQIIFTALFFTSVGMLINIYEVPNVWKEILILSVLTLIVRFVGYGLGLLLIGTPLKNSIRTALFVTPIGEFSFVIAGIGVSAQKLPPNFFVIAIGTCLLTATASPLLIRNSESISDFVLKHEPRWLHQLLKTYRRWIEAVVALKNRSLIWKFSQKRIIQIIREVLIVTGIVIFSQPIYPKVESWYGTDLLFPSGTLALFVCLMIGLAAAPMLSLWRNLGAVSMIYAEAIIPRHRPEANRLRRILELAFMSVATIIIVVWLWTLIPQTKVSFLALGLILIAALAIFVYLRRQLILLHSKFELSMEEALSHDRLRKDQKLPYLLDSHQDWDLTIVECTIPEDPAVAGQSLANLDLRVRFDVSVAGIERHGFLIGNPRPETRLYPGDRVLLIGNNERIKEANKVLSEVEIRTHQADFEDMIMETVAVPPGYPHSDKTLIDLQLPKRVGVQVAAIRRNEKDILNPSGSEKLEPGDLVLVIGSPQQVSELRVFLENRNAMNSSVDNPDSTSARS